MGAVTWEPLPSDLEVGPDNPLRIFKEYTKNKLEITILEPAIAPPNPIVPVPVVDIVLTIVEGNESGKGVIPSKVKLSKVPGLASIECSNWESLFPFQAKTIVMVPLEGEEVGDIKEYESGPYNLPPPEEPDPNEPEEPDYTGMTPEEEKEAREEYEQEYLEWEQGKTDAFGPIDTSREKIIEYRKESGMIKIEMEVFVMSQNEGLTSQVYVLEIQPECDKSKQSLKDAVNSSNHL